MPYLDEKNISVIQDLLFLDTETCGFLLPIDPDRDPEKLQIFVDSVGEISKDGRKICILSKYTEYIWHTHPVNSKGYPSIEDILKSLKLRPTPFPLVQVIFTTWGIWQLKCKNKIHIDNKLEKYFHHYIGKELDTIYHQTEKGRGKFANSFLNQQIDIITQIVNKKYKFGLEIYFTPWDSLNERIDILPI